MDTPAVRRGLRADARRLLVLLVVAAATSLAFAEEPGEAPLPGTREVENGRRVPREEMWRAPTAEDWKKPVLIRFQRTWEDAVAVSKETGKPILVCINMDGEIASEHYAGVRYRQPEVAELYKPYVCVIASVYRHTPRDYDDEGNRILCPRFGSVTCGEHIAIEPVIYEKFCDGRRIAPRHIAVDLEKQEVYDVYYVNDTAGVFEKIRDGIEGLPPPKPPIVRGDRPVLERVASAHIDDREAVEAAYQQGDAALRAKILELALEHPEVTHLDLIRMAIFGLDTDLAAKAREALTKVDTPMATPLISDAIQVPMDEAERQALLDTLERLGDASPVARWLAGVHRGLAARSSTVDPSAWDGGATYPAAPAEEGIVWRAEQMARAAAERPDDADAQLAFADANIALAIDAPQAYPANQRLARRVARASYEEAYEAARRAADLGAEGWTLASALTLGAYYTERLDEAYAHAEKAMAVLPEGDGSWRTLAVVTIFAESRWKGIQAAVKSKEKWPPAWLADLHAAYGVLLKHPLGTVDQVVWHHDFLVWLGADHRAFRVLDEGLKRFPTAPALHERLRRRLIRKRGPEALEDAYAELLASDDASGVLLPFAGRASVAAAEHFRRTQRFDEALDAYRRAVDRFEAWTEAVPDAEDAADAEIALALAGRSRVAYQLGEFEVSLADILGSFRRDPESAGTRDGMGITPGETGQMLRARLRALDREDLATVLDAALAELDPELLRPDRGLLPDAPRRGRPRPGGGPPPGEVR